MTLLHKFIVQSLLLPVILLGQVVGPVLVGVAQAADPADDGTALLGGADYEPTNSSGLEKGPDLGDDTPVSILSIANSLKVDAKEAAADANLTTKLVEIGPIDAKYLKFRNEVGDAITHNAKALAEAQNANYLSVPQSIVDQFKIDPDTNPFPVYDKNLLTLIDKLLTDPEFDGVGGEYLNISRLAADYDHPEREYSLEGGPNTDPNTGLPNTEERVASQVVATAQAAEPTDPADKRLSAHGIDHIQAVDIGAYDYIKCTKVTYETSSTSKKKKIVEKQKLDPIPIEFKWQTSQGANGKGSGNDLGNLGTNPDGSLSINNLTGYGLNFNDLLSKVAQPAILGEFSQILSNGGWRLPTDVVNQFNYRSQGSALNIGAVYNQYGEATLSQMLGTRTGDSPPIRLGNSLAQTVDQTGATILSQEMPKISPSSFVDAQNLDQLANNHARESLGRKILGSGYQFSGTTTNEILAGLGSQFVSAQLLHLSPTTALENLPLDSALAIRIAVGEIAASQLLHISLSDLKQADVKAALADRFTDLFVTNANETDATLGIPYGTSARLGQTLGTSQGMTAANYFDIIGGTFLDSLTKKYTDNPEILNHAYGLSLLFGPEDVFLPPNDLYLTREDRLGEIKHWYGSFLAETDQAYLTDHYQNPKFTDLTKDEDVQSWLAGHFHDPTDLVGPLFTGPLTQQYFITIGRHVLARLDPRPFQQLATLHQFETGEIWTLPIANSALRSPVINLDEIGVDKLGLLPGDLDRILSDRFVTAILPRLKSDMLAEATGNEPGGNGFFQGATLLTTSTDDFYLKGLETLKQRLTDLHDLQPGGEAIRQTIFARIASVQKPDPALSRSDQFQKALADIDQQLPKLLAYTSAEHLAPVTIQFAGLLAGRELQPIDQLQAPKVTTNRTLGLNDQLMSDMFRGQVTPAAAARSVGSSYLVNYAWSAPNPDPMLNDLKVAVTQPPAKVNQFYSSYKSTFDSMGSVYTNALSLASGNGLSGREFLGVFAGSPMPLTRNFGEMVNQGLTNQPGTIFSAASNGTTQTGAGLWQVMKSASLVGTVDPTKAVSQLPKQVFEQGSGILLGATARELIQNNPALMNTLGAPKQVADQFNKMIASGKPDDALNFLRTTGIWDQLQVSQYLQSRFGPVGLGAAGILYDIVANNHNPADLITNVQKNFDQYVPALASAAGLPFDPSSLVKAIKSGDQNAVFANLSQVGGQLIDSRIPAMTSILFSQDHSPKAIFNWASQTLPTMIGGPGGSQIVALVGMAGAIGSMFFGSKGTTFNFSNLAGFASQVASAAGIPYVADVMRLASDPMGFGLNAASSMITEQLNQAFGGGYINYATVRNALFGPDPRAIQQQFQSAMDRNPELASNASIIGDLAKSKAREIQQQAQKDLMYTVGDASLHLPPGFSKAMFEGDGSKKLDMLYAFAEGQLNLPPEGRVVLQLIKDKGDLSKVENLGYAYVDGELGKMLGVPVPPGFTKEVGNLLTGKESFDQFQKNMNGFGINQVMGIMDSKLGLPVGTTSTIYQMSTQFADASQKIASATEAVQKATQAVNQATDAASKTAAEASKTAAQKGLDLAKVRMAQLQGVAAGLVVSMVFGKQLAQVDAALGLPPGTASFIVSTAISSLFTGTAFLAALGAAAPFFLLGAFVLPKLLGFLGLGGSSQKVSETVCTAGGYYPYITKEDDKRNKEPESRLYDPHDNLDTYQSLKERMSEDSTKMTAEKLKLWPGYTGEFPGEDMGKTQFAQQKRTVARWKIRELLGQILQMQQFDPNLFPHQLIFYEIPKADRLPTDKNNWDYLRYYDGRETDDKRFVITQNPLASLLDTNNNPTDNLGIIDWPYEQDSSFPGRGFGDGTYHSGNVLFEESLAQESYGVWNVGMWPEPADEYRQHLHIGI